MNLPFEEVSNSLFEPNPNVDAAVLNFLSKIRLSTQAKVLDVSPTIYQARKTPEILHNAKYTAIGKNIKPTGVRFLEMDATRMSFSDSCFDLILCNQVLPYIRSDYQAMSEVHRCLKANGVAMMNSGPILKTKTMRASDFFAENPEVSPQLNREWMYGVDFYERLEAAGFFVHRLQQQRIELVLCFKFRAAKEKFLKELI